VYALPWRRPVDVADLTNSSAFTLALLDDTWRWRQRVVEELELGSGDHVRVRSNFQLEFPPDLVRPFSGPRARWIKVLLPLVTRPKRPLLNFDVEPPQGRGQAHLIRRASIAAIAGEYLGRLVASSPVAREVAPGLPAKLLEAICVTTPTIFAEYEANAPTRDLGLAAYLTDGLGLVVSADDAARWSANQRKVGEVLAAALAEPPDPYSSSEHVLLALPRLEPRPTSVAQIDAVVGAYRDAVLAAERADDYSLLAVLAEYGRRYELILELEAPLDQPFTVRVSEQRPLELRRGGWTTRRFGLRDASGWHFEARTTDHTIEIADFRVHDLAGNPVGIPPLEGARYTKEFLALSSSDPERPATVAIGLRLRPTRDVRYTSFFVAALVWSAAVAALLLPADENAFVDALNLLTVPTTFAVALVLLRDESSLAARLQRPWRIGLGVAITVLWIDLLIRLVLAAVTS
jgi:hypothetical protein